MSSYIVGRCIQEISRTMPPFLGMPESLKHVIKEYKINIGDIVSIDKSGSYYSQDGEYTFHINYQKISMTREEIEDHFEVTYEYGCYNTCIRDGVPCNKITHYISKDTTDRSKYTSNCCKIGWAIGRAACYMYDSSSDEYTL